MQAKREGTKRRRCSWQGAAAGSAAARHAPAAPPADRADHRRGMRHARPGARRREGKGCKRRRCGWLAEVNSATRQPCAKASPANPHPAWRGEPGDWLLSRNGAQRSGRWDPPPPRRDALPSLSRFLLTQVWCHSHEYCEARGVTFMYRLTSRGFMIGDGCCTSRLQ